jgi:hypothetical protein
MSGARSSMIPSKDKTQSFQCAELLSFNHIWALSIVNSCPTEIRVECNNDCKVTQQQIPTYFHLSFTFMIYKGHYNLFYVSTSSIDVIKI